MIILLRDVGIGSLPTGIPNGIIYLLKGGSY